MSFSLVERIQNYNGTELLLMNLEWAQLEETKWRLTAEWIAEQLRSYKHDNEIQIPQQLNEDIVVNLVGAFDAFYHARKHRHKPSRIKQAYTSAVHLFQYYKREDQYY